MLCNPVFDPCSPTGFAPYPQPWNPTIAPEGPEMVISDIQIPNATYFIAGKVLWFNIWAFFTLALVPPAVTGVAYMIFTLPLPPKIQQAFGGACCINAGPGFEAGPWFISALSTIQVRVGAGGPNFWTAGTFRTIIGNGFYEFL